MRLSRERLQREATTTGFRVEILEKVAQLLVSSTGSIAIRISKDASH